MSSSSGSSSSGSSRGSRPSTGGAASFQLRSLVAPVYAPTFLYAVGQGLVLPVTPLFAQDLGAGLGLIGLIVTMRGLGSMLLDVPSGVLVDRFGGRATMAGGAAVTAAAAVLTGFTSSVPVFMVLIFLGGAAQSVWMVSRLTFIAEAAPVAHRGRAISLVGGATRVGVFVGPVMGGFIGQEFGLGSAFVAQAVATALAGVFILVRTSADGAPRRAHASGHGNAYARLGATLVEHRRDFLTVGAVAFAIVLMRQGRQVLVPLWGDFIGLDVATIGLVVGLSSLVDATLFYPVGVVMDRWGRKFVVVPALALLAASLILMPVSRSLEFFVFVGVLSGIGNGLGSGVVMTLGADLAPRDRAGEFIGVWRFVADVGGAIAPIAIGTLAQAVTLGVSSVATGAVGLAGVLVMVFLVEETLHRPVPEEHEAGGASEDGAREAPPG
jgi:MFS family permease